MTPRTSILVLSRSAPPRSGGTPSVLANQLSWLDFAFVFVGQRPGARETKNNLRPGWHAYSVPPIRYSRVPGVEWLWLPVILAIAMRAVRRHRCKAIVLVLFDTQYIAAGYLLSILARLPLVLYAADLWAGVEPTGASNAAARFRAWLEKAVVSRAAAHVTNIPGIAALLEKKYGLPVELALNCYPRDVSPKDPAALRAADRGERFRIGFCGSVYWNNAERLVALSRAVSELAATEIVIFGSQSPEQLRAQGVDSGRITVRFVAAPSALLDALSECDLVYLPFSFGLDPARHRVAQIAFPTKVLDYLGSGRPILLNCPGDADLASFFGSAGAAEVVTDPSVDALRDAIVRLRDDGARRDALARRSHELAARFAGPAQAPSLQKVLDRVTLRAAS